MASRLPRWGSGPLTSFDTNAATPTSYQSIHEAGQWQDARGQAQGTTGASAERQLSYS
jgi:hypothetical protein